MLAPEVEARPWAEQLALDDATYRAQLAYLFERSAFYREKLTAAGIASAEAAGGLAEIAQLPLTEKPELKATCTPDNPIGAHLCATPSEIVRIYSTSGTTGTPSYIPLTAGDLDNWVTGSARSYAASGVTAGQRTVSSYNAGPFVAGAAIEAFDRIGLCHIPLGTGNTDRLLLAVDLLKPEVAVLTPSYAAYLIERAADRGVDLPGSSVERVLVAGEPGGGEPAFRAKLEAGWGAKVTEAMGIGDIGVSLWGECEEQDGMHLGARGFVHAELIEPETGDALSSSKTAPRASSCSRTFGTAPRRCCDSARATTFRSGLGAVRVRSHGPARALHRANRRHAHRPRRQRLPLGGARSRERVRSAGQRPDPRQAAGAGRQAGAAASGQRRAGARRDRGRRRSRRRSVRDCATYSSSRPASSSCRGEACGAANTSRSSSSARDQEAHDGRDHAQHPQAERQQPDRPRLRAGRRARLRRVGRVGADDEPRVPREVPGPPHADARGGRAAERRARRELRDHGSTSATSTASTSSIRRTRASARWSTTRCST